MTFKKAVQNTEKRLSEKKFLDRVKIIEDSHARLEKYICEKEIDGMIFNLGYLPGGNREIVTESRTTLTALEKAWSY